MENQTISSEPVFSQGGIGTSTGDLQIKIRE